MGIGREQHAPWSTNCSSLAGGPNILLQNFKSVEAVNFIKQFGHGICRFLIFVFVYRVRVKGKPGAWYSPSHWLGAVRWQGARQGAHWSSRQQRTKLRRTV